MVGNEQAQGIGPLQIHVAFYQDCQTVIVFVNNIWKHKYPHTLPLASMLIGFIIKWIILDSPGCNSEFKIDHLAH